MTGSQHFSPGDIQFQLVYDSGSMCRVQLPSAVLKVVQIAFHS